MKYVVDANVGLKMVLPEADSAKAIELQERFRRGECRLLAPDFFPVEIGHALTRAERKRIIPIGQSAALFDSIVDPCPELHPSMPLVSRAIEMSSQSRASVFDCLYLLLAEAEDCAFVTSDRKIVSAFPDESRIVELTRL